MMPYTSSRPKNERYNTSSICVKWGAPSLTNTPMQPNRSPAASIQREPVFFVVIPVEVSVLFPDYPLTTNPSQPPLVRGGAGSVLPLTRGSYNQRLCCRFVTA